MSDPTGDAFSDLDRLYRHAINYGATGMQGEIKAAEGRLFGLLSAEAEHLRAQSAHVESAAPCSDPRLAALKDRWQALRERYGL